MSTQQHYVVPAYGCIFCKTGYELTLVQELSHVSDCADFLVAQKKIRRRVNGRMTEDRDIMFPGYVFFRATNDIDLTAIGRIPAVLKILINGDKGWQLAGEDYKFVDWLFSQKGLIGFSKALVVGDKLKIKNGPLMGYEGRIIKVNRRFQNCLVTMKFGNKEFNVWVGYELI